MSDLFHQLSAALAGRYTLQRELGRGGMATVFLASDLRHHQRTVAIKVLDPELAAAIGPERFLREIAIAADLSHIHILPLYDSGVADGLLFYVMPYAEGGSLRQRLEREKQLPIADAVRIAREVAEALEFAHGRGVVHRDIKPENILLKGQHAVVADFGIARAVLASGDARGLTATGVAIGTPACMSPEQAAGSKDLDGRSDQYSLGCVLYEMLAGQAPFTGPTADSIIHQQRNVAPRPVTDLRPTVPDGVARALERTLAKTPADRFGTTAEFAAAIGAGAEPAPGPRPEPVDGRAEIPEPKPPHHRARALALAGAAIVMAYAAVARWQGWPPFQGDIAPPAKKAWILVAEFDGPTADSSVVAATRELMVAAVDQSQIVAAVPRDQVGLALQSAGKPRSTRVDAELARELAFRSAVPTVLAGKVGRMGKGYTLVLRLVEAASDSVVLSLSDAAADEDALIPMAGRMAKQLRAGLGEKKSAIQATAEPRLSITPSFEAYKAWTRGRQLLLASESRAAIAWYRSALALDPDYAGAFMGLGFAYGNLNEPDSSLAAFREADARPERLDARAKRFCTVSILYMGGDIEQTLAASEQQVQLDPQIWTAHNNRAAYLMSAGRFSEALECARTAESVSPFGASQQVLGNQFWCLLWLGRTDEASTIVPRLTGDRAQEAPLDIAAASGRWATAESLATVLWSNPTAGDDPRYTAATTLAAVQASRGQVKAADQTLRQVQLVAESTHERTRANLTRWDRLRLALFSQGVAAVPEQPGHWDSTTVGLVAHGAWAAAAGDTTLARRLLPIIRARSAPDLARQGFFGPTMVEGWLAARTGRWQEVIRLLGPAALQGEAPGYTQVGSAPLVRWLVAEAYEQLGNPDSAAAYFERAIAPLPLGGREFAHSRMAFSFGHRRLALVHARRGRLEEAKRHWEIFSATFTRPDPEMAPLVEEARAAIASADAMARSARR